jgi:hypothetical protein
MTAPDQLTFGKVLFLVAGLAGSLLINRSAQFTSINVQIYRAILSSSVSGIPGMPMAA